MLYRFSVLFFFTFFFSNYSFGQRTTADIDAQNGGAIKDHRKPSVMAKEEGKEAKKQKKAYMKQLKRAKKDIDKRNRKKQKEMIVKVKTKKVRQSKDKNDTKTLGPTPKEKSH